MSDVTRNFETFPALDSDDHNAVGKSINQYRRQRSWSLKTLSEHCYIPISTLSKVENGQMSLKVEKLLRVCQALEIDIMQLVTPRETVKPIALVTGRRSITRKDEASVSETENAKYEYHAQDFSRRKFSPVVMEIVSGSNPELISHQGEELIFVLEGRIELLTEFYEPTTLAVGDSVYIDSTMAHNVRALDNKNARILNVSSRQRKA